MFKQFIGNFYLWSLLNTLGKAEKEVEMV